MDTVLIQVRFTVSGAGAVTYSTVCDKVRLRNDGERAY